MQHWISSVTHRLGSRRILPTSFDSILAMACGCYWMPLAPFNGLPGLRSGRTFVVDWRLRESYKYCILHKPVLRMKATANFDITEWEPVASDKPDSGPELSRIEITKALSGEDLEGESKGEGLFCGMSDPKKGAGYVVSERFTGRIGERRGTFVMQHGGLMGPGQAPKMFGSIVPGSGTGELIGLSGTIEIGRDEDGKHTLTLDYAFEAGSGS